MKQRIVVVFFVLLSATLGVFLYLANDPVAAALSLLVIALGACLVLAVAWYIVSNFAWWVRNLRGISRDDNNRKLEESGKARRESYTVTDALSIEDLGTGCLAHFIDIGNGVLLLYGQHYYEYEPITDDPELNQDRQFPTQSFSLLRKVRNGELLSVFPGNSVIEPRICDPVDSLARLNVAGFKVEDGEFIQDISLDVVESALQSGRS